MTSAPKLGFSIAVRQRLIALLCAVAMLVFVLGLLLWSRGWLESRTDYRVELPKSAGLSKSSAVFINGIPVGRVAAVELAGEGGDLRVGVDFWGLPRAAAWIEAAPRKVVVRADLMGLSRLDLESASADASAPAPPGLLPAEIEPDLITQFQPRIDELLASVGELTTTLNTSIARLDPVMEKLGPALGSIQTTVDTANSLLKKTGDSVDSLQQNQVEVATALKTTLKSINDEVLPGVSTMLENQTVLRQTLDSVAAITANLQTDIPVLTRDAKTLLQGANDLTTAANHTWPFSRYHRKKAEEEARDREPDGAGPEPAEEPIGRKHPSRK